MTRGPSGAPPSQPATAKGWVSHQLQVDNKDKVFEVASCGFNTVRQVIIIIKTRSGPHPEGAPPSRPFPTTPVLKPLDDAPPSSYSNSAAASFLLLHLILLLRYHPVSGL